MQRDSTRNAVLQLLQIFLLFVCTLFDLSAQTLSVTDSGTVMRQVMNWYPDDSYSNGNCPFTSGLYSCSRFGTPASNAFRACTDNCRNVVCANFIGANAVFGQNNCSRACLWGCHLTHMQACMNGVTTSAVQCAQFREYPLKKFDPARGTLNAVSLRVQRLLMWDVYLSSAQTPRYVYDMIWFLVQAQLFSIASAGGYTIIQDTGVQRRDIADAWYDPYSSVRTYVATEFFDFGDTTFNTPGDLVLADFVGTGNALTRRSWRDGVVHSEVGSGSFGSGTNAQFLVRLELEYRYTPTGATIPVLTE